MKQTAKQILKAKVSEATGMPVEVLVPSDEVLGDYSTNAAFLFAKKGAKKNPVEVAQEIKSQIEAGAPIDFDTKVAPNGFINFFAKLGFLQNELIEISKNKNYGASSEGIGKKIIVEYSSPNIAKPMHIGHLRSTIIGDSLANVYEKLGYDVVRWNYLGDWGTQFGKIIAYFKHLYPEWKDGEPIPDAIALLNMYIAASKDVAYEEKGREEFLKLEQGDEYNRHLWELFRNQSVKDLKEVYKTLSTKEFTEFKGESDYQPKLWELIDHLKEYGLITESEGALIIELENLPPALIQKTDGATLYMTRDLASLQDRLLNYENLDKVLYVVANQQALHFEQLFSIVHKLKSKEVLSHAELQHVKFGMVLGEDGKKLATREGKVVPLQEVIDKVTEMARETVKQKNSNLSGEEMERVAHVVAIGALKYNDLRQHPYSDIEFDWKAMLDLSGNSGPYIQYTYARLANILNKVPDAGEGGLALLTEPSERMLMRQLLDYPDAIKESAERYALNGLALYLYGLAHRANQFYEQVHVVEDENIQRRDARLLLIKTVARTLQDGLALLGIETLERI